MFKSTQVLLIQKTCALGAASNPNRRLTGRSVRFRVVVIVYNNRNQPEPDGTTGQLVVEFWSRPLNLCQSIQQIG